MKTDLFLDGYLNENGDELTRRALSICDFGQPLDNEENDVPLYDQYNTGLALTEQGRERINLALEGNQCPMKASRPGVTGIIPSMEQGVLMGAMPMPRTLATIPLMGMPVQEQMLAMQRQGKM